MTTFTPVLIALTATACLTLPAAQAIAADDSGIVVQTETLVMEGKRKELEESGENPAPTWDKETVTVTEKLIFTGIRER